MNYLATYGAIVTSILLLGCSSYPTLNKMEDGVYQMVYEYSDVDAQFGRDRKKAIPEYLTVKGMMPAECINKGIVVIRAQDYEGGKVLAEFRCKRITD